MPGNIAGRKDGVATLAHSRPKDGVATLAYSRPKDGVATLAYGARHAKQNPRFWLLHQPALIHRCADEGREQRVRLERPRFQLGMELHADKPGVILVFDRLGQHAIGRHPGEPHAVLFEAALVAGVDLVAVTVALEDFGQAVDV